MNVPCRKEVKMRPRKWTKTAINQAFDDFISEHDRLPTREEMYQKGNCRFPRPLSVKLEMGMSIGDYLKSRYPEYLNRCNSRTHGKRSREYWIEDFKTKYIELDYPTEENYNKNRNQGSPNSKTMAKIIGVKNWGEVLKYCDVEIKKSNLTAELDFEETLENLIKLRIRLEEAWQVVENMRKERN